MVMVGIAIILGISSEEIDKGEMGVIREMCFTAVQYISAIPHEYCTFHFNFA